MLSAQSVTRWCFRPLLLVIFALGYCSQLEAWTGTDIGSVGVAGTDSYNSTTGVYTIQGSGADIGSTADACHFVYQSLAADGELEARVASVQNTNAAAKAGVMIRQSTSAGAIEAMIAVAPASSVTFLNRSSSGGSTVSSSVATSSPPVWVRIVKDGTLITVYESTSPTSWTYAGLVRLASLANPVDIGFAVTSHSTTVLCTATFDNISLSTQASYAPVAPWHDQDIGTVGQTGAIHLEASAWSVYGAGAGITGTADGFHFDYEAFSGNASISARIDGISAAAGSAGVIIRQDLTAGSAEAAVVLNGTSGINFLSRATSGASITTTAGLHTAAPYWVKLVRLANVCYAYESADGSTWTAVGNQTISMSGTVYVGLASTSASTSALALGQIDRVAPLPPDTYLAAGDISSGANHNLYLQNNGNISTWGLNTNGQVGDGSTTTRTAPVLLPSISTMESASGGASHSLALKNDGTVWVWGLNTNGQLGDGTTTQHASPEQLTTLSGIVAISAGASHSLALKNDGTVWAWGLNTNGQLGDGTTSQHTSPEQLTTLTGIVAISAGGSHSLALKDDGTVWTWGLNSTGQLGDGTTTQRTAPVKLTGVSGIVAISAGASHSLAIDDTGTVWAWGDNSSGEVGDGTTTQRSSPVQITSVVGATAIKASSLFSVALRSDGTVWSWGKNTSGQLGNNTTTQENSAVEASGLTGVVAISAGTSHVMAITSAGAIWAWGNNANGQFGNSTMTSSLVPVSLKPGITSPLAASATTGTAFTYSITASCSPTAFSAIPLPSGLSVNTSTGVISGTPTTVGTTNVTLSATNISGTGTATLAITVNPPPPVISSASTASGITGTSFSYTITASNSPTSYNATGLPAGLTVNTSTGLISGTPTATGSFPVALSATNSGGTGTKTLTLTVIPPPPVISSAATATGTKGVAFSYQIVASNSPTSYNATGLPAGLTVSTSTGLISGTPTATGTASVALSATNSGGTGTKTLSLTINPPAPVINSATTATGTTGVAFTYTITATNTPTSYNATGLPSGLSVATSTGKLTGTPSVVGTSSVTISATNAGGTGSATLTLTINPPPPVISSAATATATVGAAFNYTIAASNSPTSFNATSLPGGLSVNTTTGVISGTPTAAGTASVALSATNAGGTGTKTLTLTVHPAPPVISNSSTATGTKGSPFNLSIVASNSPTSYGATGLPSGLSVSSSTGLISGTPTAVGTSNATLSATNAGGTGTKPISITINPPAPVFTSPSTVNGLVSLPFSYQIAANNSPTAFNATGLPSGLSINTNTGLISGTLSTAGPTTITISATNAGGTTNGSLLLTGYNSGSLTVTGGLTAWLRADVAVQNDGNGKAQQWSDLTCNENNAAQSSSGDRPTVISGALQGNPVMHFDGSSTYLDMPRCIQDDFSIVVVFRSAAGSGGGGAWTSAGGIVDAETPGSVNDFGTSLDQNGYVLAGIGNPDTTISSVSSGYNDGRPHILTFTRAEASGIFTQYVDSVLQSSASGNTSPLTSPPQIAIGATQTLANYFGGDVAEVLIYNRVLSPSDRSQVEAYLGGKYGVPPVVSGSASGFQGAAFSYQVPATNGATSFSATGLPPGLTVNTTTGVISGTPSAQGSFHVSVTAGNSGGSGSGTVTITIYGDNPPVIATTALYGTAGMPLSAQINATNAPTTYNATGLPSGLNINTATGVISGTPTVSGTYSVTLSATNPYGTTSLPRTLNVSATLPVTSGLTAWFKAGEGISSINGSITQWNDLSGNGNNVTQSAGTGAPTQALDPSTQAPVVAFNGQQWISDPNTVTNSGNDVTIITVASSATPNGMTQVLLGGTDGGPSGRALGWDGMKEDFLDPNTTFDGGNVTQNGKLNISSVTFSQSTGAINFFEQGVANGTATDTGTSSISPRLTIGSILYYGAWNAWNGNIEEVIIYNRVLTTAERQQVETYLAANYGLYAPGAIWISSYSTAVQSEINRNQWNKSQADAYVALQANNPSMLTTGLVSWFAAGSGLSQSNGFVSSWVDQTGNSAPLSGIAGSQPTYVPNDITGQAALRFNGTQYLGSTSNANVNSDMTMIAVEAPSTTSSNYQSLLFLGNQNYPTCRSIVYSGNSQGFDASYDGTSGGAEPPVGQFTIEMSTLASDLATVTFYQNGAQTGTGILNPSLQAITPDITVGAQPSGNGGFSGDIAEVLVYDHKLSSTEIQQVTQYLSGKYGLYYPGASWISTFSSAVQTEINRNHWTEGQAKAYVALQSANPSMLTTGLKMWLKADSGVTLGTGNYVTAWADQTGSYPVAAPDITSQPTIVYNDTNGEPALRFSGSQSLVNPASMGVGLNADMTIVTVGSTAVPSAQGYSAYLGNGTNGEVRGTEYQNSVQTFDIAGSTASGRSAPQAGTFVAEASSLNSALTTVNFYRNGSLTATGSLSGVQNVSAGVNIGKQWQGDISEVLIYDHQLSTSELAQLSLYLANKYGTYYPGASWISGYASSVQTQINANQWGKAQADAYVQVTLTLPVASGLTAWFKADMGIIQESGVITDWRDSSWNNNDVVQTTASTSPTLATDPATGTSTVHFNGSQYLANTNNLSSVNDVTIFAVASTPTPSSLKAGIVNVGNQYHTNGARALCYDNGKQAFSDGSPSDVYMGDGGTLANQSSLAITAVTFSASGQLATFYNNGNLNGTTAITDSPVTTGLSVGSLLTYANWYSWQGNISEVIVYNRILTSAEIASVQSYLSTKYAVYPSAAPTITPNGGSSNSTMSVTLTGATLPAVIRFTLDGSKPTSASAAYSSSLAVMQDTTINCAIFSGTSQTSPVATAQFWIGDTDHIGIPDSWQIEYFGAIGINPNSLSPGGSGLTNLQAYQWGYNPTLYSTNGDGLSDLVNHQLGYAGNNLDINNYGLTNAQQLALGLDPFDAVNPAPPTPPATNPNDHSAPTITLTQPAGATLLP